MGAYNLNQFAPMYQQGVPQPPAGLVGYEDRPFEYIYNPPNGELTALQLINPDSVAIQTDADFWLAGWYLSLYTAAFQIQLTDASGYQLSDGMINSAAISLIGPTWCDVPALSVRRDGGISPGVSVWDGCAALYSASSSLSCC